MVKANVSNTANKNSGWHQGQVAELLWEKIPTKGVWEKNKLYPQISLRRSNYEKDFRQISKWSNYI